MRSRSYARVSFVQPVSDVRSQLKSLSVGETLPKRKPKNFIKMNLKAAIEAQPPAAPKEEPTSITQSVGFGRVPLYIHKRKLELAKKDEDKRLAQEKESLPPGMTLMSEEERQRTVELLLQNQKKLIGQLAKMPLTIETPSLVEK